MIITIARKCGCDADTIGRAVAEKYHLHFMDREAIAAGAKEAGCAMMSMRSFTVRDRLIPCFTLL